MQILIKTVASILEFVGIWSSMSACRRCQSPNEGSYEGQQAKDMKDSLRDWC